MTDSPLPSTTRYGGPLVVALEDAWAAIRARHHEIPAVVLIVGSGIDSRGRGLRLGHFTTPIWRPSGADRLSEVFVAGEGLAHGSAGVLTTLLHEAAHGLAYVRGVADTSRQGRYHNKCFKALGEELGLAISQDATRGWSGTALPLETAAVYEEAAERLARALTLHRDAPLRRRAAGGSGPRDAADAEPDGPARSTLCVCGCPRRIRVAPSVLAQGPITCGICGRDFG